MKMEARGCVCPPEGQRRVTFDECVCDWGKLTRQMLFLGYGATTLEACHELAGLGGRVNILACQRRREILEERLQSHKGTLASFCDLYRVTRSRLESLGLRRD